ncbi:TPA: LexA family transcriptional regulator [Morganella morganii]|uniref:LexA family protein n=1 Tax=Morganella morganii TaxID=582 RepID=UPI003EBA1063|nr:LexA family transcriptional regulator [Morganella morganii]
MTKPLTQNQNRVFEFIKSFIADNQYPPTRAEIAEHMGYASPNAAEEHIKALVRKGVLHVARGISRGIRVCESKREQDA